MKLKFFKEDISDDEKEIAPLSVPLPVLCISCIKYNDEKEKTPCLINRMDQMKELKKGEISCCFIHEPVDSSVN